MSGLPVVEVLLATYSGARFLSQQLDSIFAQDYANLRVLARDDGSSDETVAILEQYAHRFPDRFRLLPAGVATGSARENFLLLMQASSADYVCFADQDDVWLPSKVSASRQAFGPLEARWGAHTPLLVFSDLRVVDEQLTMLHPSFWKLMLIDPDRISRLATVLVQSLVTGCTVMVNRKLLELACGMPDEASMHDRWIALLTACFGRAAIVRPPTVLYRQHDRNVVGTGQAVAAASDGNRARSLFARIRYPRLDPGYVHSWEMSQREAQALLNVHGPELPPRKAALLTAFIRCRTSASRWLRVATFLRHGFFYPGIRVNLAMAAYLWRSKPAGGFED